MRMRFQSGKKMLQFSAVWKIRRKENEKEKQIFTKSILFFYTLLKFVFISACESKAKNLKWKPK